MRNVILLVMACMASCKAQKEVNTEFQSDSNLILVAEDGYSGIMEYEASTIRDAKSLNKFYSRINRTRKPGLPVPQIDFSKEMVIVVCMGEQEGNMIPIIRKSSEDENHISYLVGRGTKTKANSESQNVTSYPFYIYKAPRSPKEIELEKTNW
ncbi:hypothetical protein [Flagellimonas flava]|uniref:Uncharacterized protein n=1 Tax=Flagellimonas flava TaxID=570519 RepID=A0A1M5Q6Z1_9FLAO|nr:hypothetical protein [Allomuricauda flava]SHH09977.1 hypothetical protein SAMN04488116_3547 [Allomuricauda flava]